MMNRFCVLSLMLLAASIAVVAQQTVFNVPSGDVLDRGKVYAEFDLGYRPSDSLKSFTPRVVVGLGHRIEAGLNVNGIVAPGTSQTTLTPNIKWKAYDGGDNGFSFVVGNNLFLPVQNKTFDAGTWTYAEFTKTWKTNTRATFGAYYASRNVFAPAHRAGGQFAIEQGISKRVTLAADWFTGNNSAGYVTPGAVIKLTSNLAWYMCYQIGNSGVSNGNHQLLAEIGWNIR